MATPRDGWLALADTVKQVALSGDDAPARGPGAAPPKKVALAAIAISKSPRPPEEDERPDSAIREIPPAANPNDPRTDAGPVPPLEVEYDLD